MSFSTQQSESASDARVWEMQAPFLQRQFQLGQNLAGSQLNPVAERAEALTGEYLPRVGSAIGSAEAIATGTDPGGAFLRSRLGATNPYLEGVIGDLGEDINLQLGRSLAGIDADASLMGGVGAASGARGQIERGMAREAAGREFARGARDIRYGDYGRQAAEAEALRGGQLRGAAGVGALAPTAMNLGLTPFNAAWLPLQQMAAILGRPTVLSSGTSSGSGFGLAL